MDDTRFKEVIRNTKYKPGSRIDYVPALSQYACGRVSVSFLVPDIDAPGEVMLGQAFPVPPAVVTASYQVQLEFLRSCIRQLEFHDIDENITYHGRRPFDPHENDTPEVKQFNRSQAEYRRQSAEREAAAERMASSFTPRGRI